MLRGWGRLNVAKFSELLLFSEPLTPIFEKTQTCANNKTPFQKNVNFMLMSLLLTSNKFITCLFWVL